MRLPDKRISASAVPSTMPPNMASTVSCKVNTMPVLNRYTQEREMTSKSKLANISVASCLRPSDYKAGNRHFFLDQLHQQHDCQVDHDIDDGGGRKRFEDLEREFLDGARAGRQFHQADGQGHGTVLDDVEELTGQGRQDH